MPRGFRFRWFHAVMGLLWLGFVALYWSDLTSGPGHDRLRALMTVVFMGWTFVAGQLVPAGDDADETRRLMRVQAVGTVALLALVLVWVRWDTLAEGPRLHTLVLPALPALMLVVVLWQYLRADRTAARTRERVAAG